MFKAYWDTKNGEGPEPKDPYGKSCADSTNKSLAPGEIDILGKPRLKTGNP